MKKLAIILILTYCLTGCIINSQSINKKDSETFCNPVNISYRFCLDKPSRREAADPTIVWYKDRFFLFASKSGGYWHSQDLINWTFIKNNKIPVEDYAPTAIVIDDILYFMASSHKKNKICLPI